jgi:NADPH:quinone reductase-like Zn-dependent oxidoreductase
MKAIQYRSYGDYSENRLVELPQPSLNDGEVLVAMRTVGINPLDNTFRSGHYYGATPENLPRIGGQTGAGAVVASKSDAFMVGDRVFVRGPGFGISADGTWRSLLPHGRRASPIFLMASMTITPRPISRVRDI